MGQVWQEIWNTVRVEFSDIGQISEFVRVVLRLLLAVIFGGVLGIERAQKGKSAGVRTHMPVCMGAALFVLVPQLAGGPDADMTRVIQGVVAGIGFLGAGSIIQGNSTRDVKGLTTAAGIWLTAAIGIAVGMGREGSAFISTVFALLILNMTPKGSGLSESKEK